MSRKQCVLALLALCLGLAHSFSWDIVLGNGKKLEFFNNGIPTYTALPSPSRIMIWMTYDPIHNRVLFSNGHRPYIYEIATKKTISFHRQNSDSYLSTLAYDPFTELLFGSIENSIYSFLLKPGDNNVVNGSVVINLENDNTWFRDLAVDSCGKYIYWISDSHKIERAQFNGADREVIIDSNNVIRELLNIRKQKMYWIEYLKSNKHEFFIVSADLNGKNRITLYREKVDYGPEILTVSKDFIYWGDSVDEFFWQIPNKPPRNSYVKPKKITIPWSIDNIATNYETEELIKAIQDCKALKSNIDSLNVSTDASLLCVHGTKVSAKSLCECTQGYTGERCDVSVCQNYCVRGDCSISAGGKPICRCNAGYSGDRCEANACNNYCLNNGVCSLNKTTEPVCHCTEGYEGDRCNVPIFLMKCVQTVSLLNDILNADVASVTLGKDVQSTCASPAV